MKYPCYPWHHHNSQYILAADVFSSTASGWLAVVSPAHLKLREKHHGYFFLVIQDSATVRPIQYGHTFGFALQWRHNGRDGFSNHQPHDCLLKWLFGRKSKKASKLRVTGLWAGNSPLTGEFPAQKASNAENFSIWWRHHIYFDGGMPLCIFPNSSG